MKALLLALLISAPAFAAAEDFHRSGLERVSYSSRNGLGFMLGDPFGVTFKHWGGATAFDLYAALAYGPGVRFGGDFIWTLGRLERHAKFDIDAYIGAGPFFGVLQGACGFYKFNCSGDPYFGARMPLGVELLLREAPFSFGFEVAPGFGIAPGGAGFLLDALFTFRFLF